jgi:hypothetical protein
MIEPAGVGGGDGGPADDALWDLVGLRSGNLMLLCRLLSTGRHLP